MCWCSSPPLSFDTKKVSKLQETEWKAFAALLPHPTEWPLWGSEAFRTPSCCCFCPHIHPSPPTQGTTRQAVPSVVYLPARELRHPAWFGSPLEAGGGATGRLGLGLGLLLRCMLRPGSGPALRVLPLPKAPTPARAGQADYGACGLRCWTSPQNGVGTVYSLR